MRILTTALGSMLLTAAPLAAQQPATIRPGMTGDEVRAVFGAPALVRDAGEWRYLFYTNRCLPRCGSDDVVFLQDGQVVAAVLRSPARRFAGPPAAAALEQSGPRELTKPILPAGEPGTTPPARIGGIRIEPGAARPATRPPPVDLGVIRGRPRMPAAGDTLTAGAEADTVVTPAAPPSGVGITPPAPPPPDSVNRRLQREGRLQPTPPRPRTP